MTKTGWRGKSNGELYGIAGGGDFDLFISTDRDFESPHAHPPTPKVGILFIDVTPSVARWIIPSMERFLNEVPLESVVGRHTTMRRKDFSIQ